MGSLTSFETVSKSTPLFLEAVSMIYRTDYFPKIEFSMEKNIRRELAQKRANLILSAESWLFLIAAIVFVALFGTDLAHSSAQMLANLGRNIVVSLVAGFLGAAVLVLMGVQAHRALLQLNSRITE